MHPARLEAIYRVQPDFIFKWRFENTIMKIGIDIPAIIERIIAKPMLTIPSLWVVLNWIINLMLWDDR